MTTLADNRRRRTNAARQLLSSKECQSLLRTCLEMLGRQLALSGFALAEPKAMVGPTELTHGVQAFAHASLTDPLRAQPLELRAVLTAHCNFGVMSCELWGYPSPERVDPDDAAPPALLCIGLFEAEAVPYDIGWSTEELRKALHQNLLKTVNAAFDKGVSGHALRFRQALEEALSP